MVSYQFKQTEFDDSKISTDKIEFLDDIENFYFDNLKDDEKTDDKTSDCATFWNICNTIQGLPILTIPYIVLIGGWYSIMAICVVALLTDYACVLLYESLNAHNSSLSLTSHRYATSYEDLGELALGSYGRKLLSGCMFLQTLFVASVYPLLVGSMLESAFGNSQNYLWGWVLVGSVLFIPSSLVKNLEQVSWTSIVTVICAKIIFVVLIVYSIQQFNSWTIANLSDFNLMEFPGAVAILLSCYLAQPFVPSICSSMSKPNHFKGILHWSIISMTLLNIIVGVCGDAAFRPYTKQAITNNLPEGAFRLILNALGITLAFTSYTLPIFTSFGVFERCVGTFFDTERLFIDRPIFEIHKVSLVLLSVAIAAFVPYLPLFLALVCSTAGVGLEFILPPIIYMKLCGDNITKMKSVTVWLLCIVGIILMLGCMSITGIALIHNIILSTQEML